MKFDVCVPNYDEAGSSEVLRKIAVEAEELGCDSVLTTDHIFWPNHGKISLNEQIESLTILRNEVIKR
jgi:alkanesulfonate monooxygenase SsuD/methylene tetrahydromethanopterin reductase-like flavin-dependent oxidoreductase (luciferase family)